MAYTHGPKSSGCVCIALLANFQCGVSTIWQETRGDRELTVCVFWYCSLCKHQYLCSFYHPKAPPLTTVIGTSFFFLTSSVGDLIQHTVRRYIQTTLVHSPGQTGSYHSDGQPHLSVHSVLTKRGYCFRLSTNRIGRALWKDSWTELTVYNCCLLR